MESIDRDRLRRKADEDECSVAFQETEVSVEIVRRGYGIDDKVVTFRLLFHRAFVFRDNYLMGAEPFCLLFLSNRVSDESHFSAESMGELECHVSQPASSDHAHLFTTAYLSFSQRIATADSMLDFRSRTSPISKKERHWSVSCTWWLSGRKLVPEGQQILAGGEAKRNHRISPSQEPGAPAGVREGSKFAGASEVSLQGIRELLALPAGAHLARTGDRWLRSPGRPSPPANIWCPSGMSLPAGPPSSA